MIESLKLPLPLTFLFFFYYILYLKGKNKFIFLLFLSVFFPLLSYFLINSIINQKKKYLKSIENISVSKAIIFFYTGFIPIVFFSILSLTLKTISLVGIFTMIIILFYSSLLSMKYITLFISNNYSNDISDGDILVIFIIYFILYSFFLLFTI